MSRNHVTLHRHLAWNVPDLSNQLKVNSAHKVKSFVSFSRTQGLVKIAHFHSAVYQNSAACRYLRKSILINFFPLSWLIISALCGPIGAFVPVEANPALVRDGILIVTEWPKLDSLDVEVLPHSGP
jgi:hypothetical protein